MRKLRILLTDDHAMMREGLRMLVAAQADMEVIGEADNGRAAIALARTLQPDVVVMDVSMPELNGFQATQTLHAAQPAIKILALSRHMDNAYLQQLLKAGAAGYVLKQSASDELVRAIRAVTRGQTYIDPALGDQVARTMAGTPQPARFHEGKTLSRREEEVLRLVAWGLLGKEIADRLQVSVKTIESHKANAMSKLGMTSRADIMRYAVLQGWLHEDE